MVKYLNEFIVIFVIIYLIDYIFILRPKLKTKKEVMEVSYLIMKFKINKNTLYSKKLFRQMALLNSFIISLTSTILINLNIHLSLKLLIGFILLISLIYSMYELLGRHLVRRK